MCVICFSPKGVDAPTEEQIRDMFLTNPDGAGYAYNGKNGKVFYKKGFMKVEDLLEELEPLGKWKNKNLGLHFRIGTAGKNDAQTCHPFEISSRYEDLRKVEGNGPVLFHNGILADGGMLNEHSSDTQDFVAAFAPILEKYNKSKTRDKWIEEIISNNKLLVMYDKNKYKMYGEWKKDGELFVSNLNYKYESYARPYETKYYPNGCYAYSNYGYGEYYGEYEFWVKQKEEEKARRVFAEEKEQADILFDALKEGETLWCDDEEMETLLEWADDYTGDTLTKGSREYKYDYMSGEVRYLGKVKGVKYATSAK